MIGCMAAGVRAVRLALGERVREGRCAAPHRATKRHPCRVPQAKRTHRGFCDNHLDFKELRCLTARRAGWGKATKATAAAAGLRYVALGLALALLAAVPLGAAV